MKYPIAPLFVRPWILSGISPGLIESHYEINYGGTVNRLNAIVEQLDRLDPTTTPPEVIHRLKRDEFTALNSMLLHELYFSSIGGDGRAVPAEMTAALTRDFGSVNRWRDEFIGLAGSLAATGGAGWVLVTFVPRDGRLINHVATDDNHAIAGGIPVLAIDMYEHAYHIDFGADAASYVETFLLNIDWDKANAGYAAVVEHATVHLAAPSEEVLANRENVTLLDVRRAGAYDASNSVIAGATWCDPEKVVEWSSSLPEKPVVVYCVYGHEVGQSTAAIIVRLVILRLASSRAAMIKAPISRGSGVENRTSSATSATTPLIV